MNKDELYAQALVDAKRYLKRHTHPPVNTQEQPPVDKPKKIPHSKFEKDPVIEKLVERWGTRDTERHKEPLSVTTDTVIVSVNCTSNHMAQDHVYSVIGDHKISKTTGSGVYVADVHDGKFVPPHVTPVLFLGTLVHKHKIAQRVWTLGDIRSYNHVDDKLYKQYMDPALGRAITAPVATALLAKDNHHGKPIAIVGLEPASLSAWEQSILKQQDITCT